MVKTLSSSGHRSLITSHDAILVERAPTLLWPHRCAVPRGLAWLPLGHVRPGCVVLCRPGRASLASYSARPHAGFCPNGLGLNEIPFHFHFGLNSNLNFESLQQLEYLSKIHETCSVGFIILSSIQEKYQT
jgi:hypothetical protein